MALCLLRKPFNLLVLWFVLIVPSQVVTDCDYGEFFDGSACAECSACPALLILNDIYLQLPCYHLGVTCPFWCSPRQADPLGFTLAASRACFTNKNPPTTQSPAVPQVNVTITEPRYNSTANAYTVSCTASFRDMGIPTLEWYSPSGQLLAPTDTSGKWKVTEGGVTQEVVTQDVVTQGVVTTTLLMEDFQEGDEGNYVCAAQEEERSDNRTILLEYVEPPVLTSTLSSTTSPSQTSIKPKPTPDESDSPKEGGLSTLWIIVIVLVGGVLCLCVAICAFLILKWRHTRTSRGRTQRSIVTVADAEAHPLVIQNNLLERLILETSDFMSATVKGLQACLDQPNCEAVIIKKNRKMIGKVRSNQDTFFIEPLAWNDSIGVWMEYSHKNIFLLSWMKCFQRDDELIKTLKMKCLKVGNVAETSAHISCPSIENTFYMHYEEKNALGGSSSAGAVELMHGGSREISDLRPSVTYSVQLGIKGQTGDSGDYNWVWKEEFTTRSITVQSVTPSNTSAKVTLSEHSIPESVQLYYEINQAKPKLMTSAEISISPLIPGMEQVLQIKVKEIVGGIPSFRLLEEKTFTTSGSVEGGGDYRGYATTDCPNSDPEEEDGPSNTRKKKPSRANVPTKCGTGLLEAIHTLRDSEKFKQVYLHTEQCVLEAVLESLLDFLKDHKDFTPRDKYVLNVKGKQRGMENIEGFINLYTMQDYTGIFDLLRRFLHNGKVHTQAGVLFAEQLLEAHSSDLRTCHVCKHAVFLLRWYVERQSSVDSRQSSVC